jgi:hypothetical protein
MLGTPLPKAFSRPKKCEKNLEQILNILICLSATYAPRATTKESKLSSAPDVVRQPLKHKRAWTIKTITLK